MNTPNVSARITWVNDNPSQNKKAAASVTIANAFQVHGVSIVDGPKGLFVSMPQRQMTDKNGEKKFVEIAHPVTADMRKAIYDAVLGAYTQAMNTQLQVGQKKESEPKLDSTEETTEQKSSEDDSECDDEVEDEALVPIMGSFL